MHRRTLTLVFAIVATLLPSLPAAAGPGPTTRYVDINDGSCDNATVDSSVNPYCDIQDAVDDSSPGDMVEVAAGTYVDNDADDRVIDVAVGVTITGAGVGLTIIDGQDSDTGVRIDGPADPVTIDGVTITQGAGIGGIFLTGGAELTVENSAVTESAPTGIYVATGTTLTLDTVTVSDNLAPSAGGGLTMVTTSGTTAVTITDSTFEQNAVTLGPGGAIYLGGAGGTGTLDITGTDFLFNDASSSGGGLFLASAGVTTTIVQSVFRGNGDEHLGGGSDTDTGGAIWTSTGTTVIDQSLFYENEADTGGAIYATASSVTIRNTTIHDNHANSRAGGVADFAGVIENSTITGNSTDGYAGGLDAHGTTKPTVRNSIIADNTSVGGAPDCDTIGLGHYNIIGDSTGCSFDTSTGNILDTDPALLALADNGGPTMTQAFAAGAPPHNAADPADPGSGGNSCRTVDQRDDPRDDDQCDIGAFELLVPSATRLSGSNRFATAAEISMEFWPDGADTVIIANGGGFPDALAAANLYGVDAPLLLVSTDSIPADTDAELDRLSPTTIYVLGGTAVVNDSVATELAGWGTVQRLSGANRYATTVAITEEAFPGGVDTVFVASGSNFPDALAGGPAAIGETGALLITTPTSLPAVIETEITRLDPDNIYVLGGPAAVSDAVVADLGAIATTTRVSGANRYATAVEISEMFFAGGADTALVATAFNFPDALAGSLASGGTAPLLLVGASTLPTVVSDEITRLGAVTIFVLGGTAAVDAGVFSALEALITP